MNQPPQQIFTSGSVVSGTLTFDLDKPRSYEYISVSLVGRAEVWWKVGKQHYRGFRKYVNLQIIVWKKEQVPDGKLQPGHYCFPFRFTLPNGQIPASFCRNRDNYIRYYLEGRIGTGLLKFDHITEADLPVTEVMNINLPRLQRPVRGELQRTRCFWCCASGTITLTAEIPRSGYCIGEVIPLNCMVENSSSQQTNVSAKLQQIVTYIVRDRARDQVYTKKSSLSVLSALSEPIRARTSSVWSPGEEFKISTATAPTLLSCDILTVVYVLIVTVVIPWSINCQKITFPLTIGNVQFCDPREATGSHPSTTVPLLNLIRAFAAAAAATDVSSCEQNEELDTTELSALLV